jgi:DNA-directed RNA polymerase subunit E"
LRLRLKRNKQKAEKKRVNRSELELSEKACTNCHFITKENVCPKCRSTSFSEDYSGLVVMFDPDNSAIAKAMNIKEKGKYALKVR